MRLIGFLIAIVLAITAGVAVIKFMNRGGSPSSSTSVVVNPAPVEKPVQTVDILVAMKEIPIGTKIAPDMIDKQPWPANLVLDQFIVSGSRNSDIIGMVTRAQFQSREPLILNKLANPNDPSFLAAALPAGMRAVSVSTSAATSVSGFVFPGDRVDVLYTHDLPLDPETAAEARNAGITIRPDRVSELLLQNVRVLAIDQRSATATNDKLVVPNHVTLEVTQEGAQKLRLAEKDGTIGLSLRSIRDRDATGSVPPTEENDITHAAAGPATNRIAVIRGTKRRLENTGGEVPASAPPAPPASDAVGAPSPTDVR